MVHSPANSFQISWAGRYLLPELAWIRSLCPSDISCATPCPLSDIFFFVFSFKLDAYNTENMCM